MKNDDLDKLLDAALADYAAPDLPAGLEQRVLNRVRASQTKRKFAIPRWAFAVPALAAVVLAVAVVWIYQHPTPELPVIAWSRPEVVPPRNWASKPQPRATLKQSRKPQPGALPKQPVFPAPMPLSDEERALFTLVRQSPEQVQETLSEVAQRGVEPIKVSEINIRPLEGDSLQ